ncbi:TetR/AcrR family transcriptional regulator [Undibacterium sp. CY18W]|uniref:TetR/AcrR family transcriptional regulator n=1 Tax=Undibacterium hunanense TaxID=2762292 RepID=A0ABR6ZNH4_9BURK|nr:TetR/AcrR family transcriptional regulator [Undibacterium hunanense]MBC3917123.1 TetR/AcrR family transcriptional regulator [Undibacterium hunanense]
MASDVRQRMIEGAMTLLAQRGLQSTSFSEVVATTGAPRGSLYHHFPDGKDQLVAAAIDLAGDVLIDFMNRCPGSSAEAVVQHFLLIWRTVLTRSGCESGCAVLAVTVATDSSDLLAHATAVFRTWRTCLADLLKRAGLPDDDARRFAMVLIASVEGAVVLSRAERSLEPFEAVAQQLVEQARRLQEHIK